MDGNELIADMESKYTAKLYPESETHFFGLCPDIQIEFISKKNELAWRQDEENYTGILL